MILAFITGAAIFGAGILTGASLVQGSIDKVLNAPNSD